MIRLLICTILIASVAVVFCKSGGNLAAPIVGSAILGVLVPASSERRSVGWNLVEALALGMITGAIATIAYWKAIQGRWIFDDGEELLGIVIYAGSSAIAALTGSAIAFRFKK
jgi:hypothetical protein